MNIVDVDRGGEIVEPGSSRVSSGTKTIAQDRLRPVDEVVSVVRGNIRRKSSRTSSTAAGSCTSRIYEVMIVSIRAAGMVDQLLNIRGRNVSDFEQAIG
ncbi:hypothetical protein, partial [Sphingobium sp. D43FB]|uniref:hypothetical protein n=1 Tax=Sphingobium sp. D43FB TaxID=2017595 RepID=UPI001143715E